MIISDLVRFFRKECSSEFDFIDEAIRDDKKEKSLTIYESSSQVSQDFNFGTQQVTQRALQIQIVYTNSKSQCERKSWDFYNKYIMSDQKFDIDGITFQMTPRQNRTPIYLGTLANGCHKYGIDIILFSK